MRVAVIGGGWAGLAAAVELTAGGTLVTLFEAGRVPGGRARAVDIDGRRLDNGQHLLLGAYRETLALMVRVGADPARLLVRHPLQILSASGFRLALPRLPAPLNLAWGLLTVRGSSLADKLGTVRWMRDLQRRDYRLAADTSVAAWLDAGGQQGAMRRQLWEPLCLAALNTPPACASAQIFANVLRDSLGSPFRADTDLLLPRADLGSVLPEPAVRWLAGQGTDIRLGTRVASIERAGNNLTIAGETFAAAIVATAPQHAARLLPDMPEIPLPERWEPIATVYLQFAPNTRLPFPLFNLDGKCGQWVVDRGNGLFACVLSGHGDWEALSDTDLVQALRGELAFAGSSSWQAVIREKRATFSCRPGMPRPACATADPRIFLAGDYVWSEYPATLESAVRSGLAAARATRDLSCNRAS
jgi:squalene-associated FAD-dependent desaturase